MVGPQCLASSQPSAHTQQLVKLFLAFSKSYKMTNSSQVITEYGKQNIFARETPPQLVENYTNYPKEAEKTNGRWAMVGMISLLGSYVSTGQIIPGIF